MQSFQIMSEVFTVIFAIALLRFMGPNRHNQMAKGDPMTVDGIAYLSTIGISADNQSLNAQLGECSGVG